MSGHQKHLKKLKRKKRQGKRQKEAQRILWRDRNKSPIEMQELQALGQQLGLAP